MHINFIYFLVCRVISNKDLKINWTRKQVNASKGIQEGAHIPVSSLFSSTAATRLTLVPPVVMVGGLKLTSGVVAVPSCARVVRSPGTPGQSQN